jgi:hypothetical protein
MVPVRNYNLLNAAGAIRSEHGGEMIGGLGGTCARYRWTHVQPHCSIAAAS